MARAPQVPGAPVAAHAEPQDHNGDDTTVDPRDAEIAALRAQLAANATPSLIQEADGPNGRKYRAESQHLHLTSAELHKAVRTGEVKLADHHVLCKDGWYVNPAATARDAN